MHIDTVVSVCMDILLFKKMGCIQAGIATFKVYIHYLWAIVPQYNV